MVSDFKRTIVLISLFILPIFNSLAQSFRADVSSTKVSLNESFQIDFTLDGATGSINPPDFKNFTVLSGPSSSSNIQMINGAVTQSLTYTYILSAQKKGKFTIDPAIAVVNGRKIRSNSVTIEVFDAPQNNNKQQKGSQNPNSGLTNTANIGDNLFVRISVNKSNPYQGEQIIATAKIYYRVTIADLQLSQTPKLTGFWLQDVKLPQNPQVTKETVNGKQYNVATIYKVLLFPQNQGELIIDPIELETIVRLQVKQNNRSPFDNFFNDPFFGGNPFGYQDVKQKVKSGSVKINVKPYPSKAPSNFDNLTGVYSMEVTPDKTKTKTNEPVTLKITVKGKGNIKLISPFELNLPSDIETYEPKVDEKISNTVDVLTGSKTFEYLLIPRREGNYKIPPVTLCFFDPDKAKFVTLTSKELNISVAKGSGQYIPAGQTVTDQNTVDYKGKDILFIHLGNTSFQPVGYFFVKRPVFIILLLLPFLLFIIMILLKRKVSEIMNNTDLLKMRRAGSQAYKRLKKARIQLKLNNSAEFYASISNALYGYLSDKLNIDIAELNKENIKSELLKRNINEELINKLIDTLDNCDFIRYAPSQDLVNMSDFYTQTENLISSIEKQIIPVKASHKIKITICFITLLYLPSLLFSQDFQSLFNKANTFYQKKDFKKAIELYDSIQKSGFQSPDLYFNMGNAHFKLQQYPQAILYYERAKRMTGNNEDVVFNIALTNLNIADKIDPINELWIVDTWNKLVNSRDSESWSIILIVILWCSLLFITLFNFSASTIIRKITSFLFLLSFISFIFTGIITYKRYKIETNINSAIVFTPTVYVKSAPDAQSTDIFIIHEGVKVEIIEKVGEWYQVKLADGKKGWLLYNNLEII
jgi:tetratricopeptide (TPR) repeat protein